MERIFPGEVYEVLPQKSGLVFSYCNESGEKTVTVSYKMISFDTERMTDVPKDIYLLSKFGSNYRQIVRHCENYITAKSILLPNGKDFLIESDGKAALFDASGEPIWTGDLIYRDFAPASVVIYNNSLWACYSDADVLVRFNLTTLNEELRIGGSRSPFDQPNHLFADGGECYVCNKGSRKLIRVDLNNYTVSDYREFSEPVLSYVRLREYEFVRTESGLYVL